VKRPPRRWIGPYPPTVATAGWFWAAFLVVLLAVLWWKGAVSFGAWLGWWILRLQGKV
jgi:hypothetical protein